MPKNLYAVTYKEAENNKETGLTPAFLFFQQVSYAKDSFLKSVKKSMRGPPEPKRARLREDIMRLPQYQGKIYAFS